MINKKIGESDYIEGEIRITQKGIGYVVVPDIEYDIEISKDNLNTALNKDTVLVLLSPGEKKKGKIEKVIDRHKTKFIGVIKNKEDKYEIIPDDFKVYKNFSIEGDDQTKRNVGKKVLVKLTSWTDGDKNPNGKIIAILGNPGENEVEMKSILLSRDLDITFPDNIEKEAKNILRQIDEKEIKKRKDLRKITTFTIDPKNAKDFDDALSVMKLPNGNYEIGIHIADVTFYVKPGSAIDNEAVKRGTSIYLVDRTIPMLPEILSNDVCSLKPKEDKLTFSAIFTLNKDAEICDEWFGKTIINSDNRFTYEEAQEVIDNKIGLYREELLILNTLSKILRKKKFENGAIDFEDAEVVIDLDENGNPVTISKKNRMDSNMLIEEFMLLANKKVALRVYELIKRSGIKKPFIYRVHEAPNQERIDQLLTILSTLGYKIEKSGKKITGKVLNELLRKVKGKGEESLVQQAAIKSMSKAVYSITNIGHFGLAYSHYTHFTSPIRRYPDMMVHRLLMLYLDGDNIREDDVEKYDLLASHTSGREKIAEEAERDSIKLKQTEYMQMHIGETWDGVISGVTKWGIYVQDLKTKSEGLIRIGDLGKEYFNFNEEKMSVIGEKSKKKFQLGDKIKVKVRSADTQKRQINLELF